VNVEFDPSLYSVSERDGSEKLVVILTKSSTEPVIIDISTLDDTATG